MKKIILSFICFFAVLYSFSQDVEMDKNKAFSIIQKGQLATGFSDTQLRDMQIAQAFSNTATGITYIYLQQTFKNIPVHNSIIVLAFKNGEMVSKAGTLLADNNTINEKSVLPVLAPSNAVTIAAAYVQAKRPLQFPIVTTTLPKINFGTLGIAYEDITAQLFWLRVQHKGEKKSIKLIWEIFIAPANTDDMWQVRVDAITNEVLEKNNLTVYEQFAETSLSKKNEAPQLQQELHSSTTSQTSPAIISNANYLVIPYPVESPLYGAEASVANPWTLAGASNANAVSLKWHNDGVTDYIITRGNNAWATEDRANTNTNVGIITPTGLPATSSTATEPLNFNFIPDYTLAPTDPLFQQYAITNLFYWNNLMHDLTYNYGFNEITGNFQANNQGRGGAANDYVIAIAQSASGTNNANFGTPPDGGRPRMRMYLFTAPNPDRDGDLDAGIMAHEYTHGISSRLTGGVAGNAGCLSNAEEAGEGWSDYFGLMMTTNWATAQITDGFNISRPIGNYVLAQTAAGNGIRTKKYSTNFTVNNLTYAFVAASGGEVHDIGEVWAATLWDMTWNMIQIDGINPNLFNATATGGNSAALKLVIEGMKLQPCSPGFIDGRDAILAADQLLYAGRYHCAILNAFARRGMGTDARQGSSGSTGDQTVGFSTLETKLTLTQSVTQQQEGLTVTYTNKVVSGTCSIISNFIIRDTLPLNVTYLSGGTYTPATRVVSFIINQAAGTTQTYPYTVTINSGSYFPTFTLFQDQVTGTAIPAATWTTSTTTATNWGGSNARSHSAPSSYFSLNTVNISDQRLFSSSGIVLGATPPPLSFWHWYNMESTYDGAVVEISTDGGTTYNDIGAANFTKNGYNDIMDITTLLGVRPAFTGSSNGFIKSVVNLTPYANQTVKFRFRNTTDNGTAVEGWYVDDITLQNVATVDIKSTIFSNTGSIVQAVDTFTLILPTTACIPVSITGQPAAVTSCSGASATFSVIAQGSAPAYQWQLSTDGINYSNISGETNATLVIANTLAAMNGYKYRVIISNSCPSSVTSSSAILTVNSGVAITAQPAATTVCTGSDALFTVTATGSAPSYQWQVSTNGGTSFTNITGATTASLNITAVTTAMNNNLYHVIVSNNCPSSVTSSNVLLTVQIPPAITNQPQSVSVCNGTSASFSVSATGTNISYQWQSSATGCSGSFTNIVSANAATYTVPAVSAAMNGMAFKVIVSGTCVPATVVSTCVLIAVNASTSISTQPADVTKCIGTAATFNTAASGSGLSYQWQLSTDAGTAYSNIAGETNATLTLANVTAAMGNNKYRAVVASTCASAINTNAATLTVQSAPLITAQPQDITVCTTAAVFTVTATGTGIQYQWQQSIDGINYTNIAGANASSITLAGLTPALANYKYRVVVFTTACGMDTSIPVMARIGVLPVVTLSVAPATIVNPAHPAVLSASVNPSGNYIYQWKRNNIVLPVLTTSINNLTGLVADFGTYVVTATDAASGCTGISNPITITDIDAERNRLFIWPNPVQNLVRISYYSSTTNTTVRIINIYDSKGAKILTKAFSTMAIYENMILDLSAYTSGVYLVELRDNDGKRVASERVIKL